MESHSSVQDLDEPINSSLGEDGNISVIVNQGSDNVLTKVTDLIVILDPTEPASVENEDLIIDKEGGSIITVFVPVDDNNNCTKTHDNLFDVQVDVAEDKILPENLDSPEDKTEDVSDILSESNDDFNIDTGGGSDRIFGFDKVVANISSHIWLNTKIEIRDLWDDLLSVNQNQISWMIWRMMGCGKDWIGVCYLRSGIRPFLPYSLPTSRNLKTCGLNIIVFYLLLRESWDLYSNSRGMFRLMEKLTKLKFTLKEWNTLDFGSIFNKIEQAQYDVEVAENDFGQNPIMSNLIHLNKMNATLTLILSMEEDFWKQKYN
ncbi:hypothetical protein OROMI_004812 [Orobanche minor]